MISAFVSGSRQMHLYDIAIPVHMRLKQRRGGAGSLSLSTVTFTTQDNSEARTQTLHQTTYKLDQQGVGGEAT